MQMAADQNFSLSDRTPQRSDGLHPAHHVVLDAGPVCLSELFHGLAVAEHCQSLLERLKVLRAHEDGRRRAVAGDDDAFVVGVDPLDELGETVPDGSQ